MGTGSVLRFDAVKGYGFVAPDDGTDDAFFHVNDMLFDKRELSLGASVEFVLEKTGRGPKASQIRLVTPPAPVVAAPVADDPGRAGPEQATVVEEDVCDVLSPAEYLAEVTESLLTCQSLAAGQILEVRERLLAVARTHGWIDDGHAS